MPIKPQANVSRQRKPKKAYAALFEPQFEIATWCRDDHAELPPEQVHLIIHWPADWTDIPPMALRFKSPDTLGFLIEELTNYRREVWPDCEPVLGEIDIDEIRSALQSQPMLKAIDEVFDDLTKRIQALKKPPAT